jgi:hypothetical protein
VSADLASDHAQSEFEKFRITQDRLFESDFDRAVKQVEAVMAEGANKGIMSPGPQ